MLNIDERPLYSERKFAEEYSLAIKLYQKESISSRLEWNAKQYFKEDDFYK